MTLLSVQNLVASYGPIRAVNSVSFNVNRGQMIGIVGRNGAGKSTIMRSICGLHRPSGGSINFDGQRIDGQIAHQTLRQGIAYVPEGRKIFSDLSVLDNLILGGYARSSNEREKQLELVYGMFPVLAERARQAGGTLSGGQQQMLAIGRALMSNPKLLLLDEPSMGLAPIVVNDLFDVIRMLHKSGLTIIIVEQKAFLTLKMVDFAHVVVHGSISASGSGAELLNSDAVQASYLGKGASPVMTGNTSSPQSSTDPLTNFSNEVKAVASHGAMPKQEGVDRREVLGIDQLALVAPTTSRLRWPGR